MKRLDLWRWRYFDPVDFKWGETTFALTEAEAKLQFPEGAEKVRSSLHTRLVPDDEADASPSSEATEATKGLPDDRQ